MKFIDGLFGRKAGNLPATPQPNATASTDPFRTWSRSGYMRDTRSGIIAARPTVLRDHREDVRAVWTRAAALAMDMINNSGRLRGAVDQVIADTVGSELVLNPQPDLRLLGYSPAETERFIARVKRHWKRWAWSPRECDLRGKLIVPQMVDVALRHTIAYGESVAILSHMPSVERKQYGIVTGNKALIVTPTKLVQDSNETERLFQGVIFDQNGRPASYRFDEMRDMVPMKVDYPAFDQAGRPRIMHIFEPQDAADVRGISPLAAGFKKMLSSEMLDDVTLQTAILQTVYAAVLTSPNPSVEAFEAIESLGSDDLRQDYRDYFLGAMEKAATGKISISGDPLVSHLAPGEDLKILQAQTPGSQYLPFSANLARELARAIGITYGALTLDYAAATYSSVRMENASVWPVVLRRRERIAAPLYQAIYEHWLDEEISSGRLWINGGYEAFEANRDRICWAQWRGPAMPTADDLKSAKAATERLRNGTSSLEIEAALNGVDDAELFEQRLREHKRYSDAGMPSPFEARPSGERNKPDED